MYTQPSGTSQVEVKEGEGGVVLVPEPNPHDRVKNGLIFHNYVIVNYIL